MGAHIECNGVKLWVEQVGEGPDVLLLGGLTDPVESWQFQLDGLADRYRLTAFDNRGAGRSPEIPEGFTIEGMADDAAAVLRAKGITSAHVTGFSGGSLIAQNLTLRHPDLVRSLVLVSTWARPDAYVIRMVETFKWLMDVAPSERAAIEAFFLWIYTPRAHENGMVDAIIEDALAFPHPQSPDQFRAQVDTFMTHDTLDRLSEIAVPTLVVAGDVDIITPPRLGKVVADGIADAKFVVLPGEAHQPFQESPEEFNAMVDSFWQEVEART